MRAASLVLTAVAAALLPAAGIPAQAKEPFTIRRAESRVAFTVRKFGVFKVEGRFNAVSGAVAFDPRHPEAARVALRVEIASVDTGERARDKTLVSDDFFDAARYPEMTFVSTRVEPSAPDAALVTGNLTIKGVTRRVTVPVRLLGQAGGLEGRDLIGFEAGFTLDRRDFGVLGTRWSGGRSLIGNEVTVSLAIAAARGGG